MFLYNRISFLVSLKELYVDLSYRTIPCYLQLLFEIKLTMIKYPITPIGQISSREELATKIKRKCSNLHPHSNYNHGVMQQRGRSQLCAQWSSRLNHYICGHFHRGSSFFETPIRSAVQNLSLYLRELCKSH